MTEQENASMNMTIVILNNDKIQQMIDRLNSKPTKKSK